jgi:hypothetical protein
VLLSGLGKIEARFVAVDYFTTVRTAKEHLEESAARDSAPNIARSAELTRLAVPEFKDPKGSSATARCPQTEVF